jgi:pheromone shutdown protein TraB
VVLELCDERFLSVSLEAQIKPRVNATLMATYDTKMTQALSEARKRNSTSLPFANLTLPEQLFSALRFASGQGVIGGAFVMLGLFIGGFQRATRVSSGDEFVTAMREAETLNVPVLLADAPQSDTLNSIRRVASIDAVNPLRVAEGCQSLAFSAFGLWASASVPRSVPRTAVRASEWVSIPRVFLESETLGWSLLPLLVLALSPYAVDLVSSVGTSDVSTAVDPHTSALWDLLASSPLGVTVEAFRQQLLSSAELLIDVGSMLFLVRMSRIIGAERDDFMARNLQAVCRRYPDRDVVVVIGMLHCNGIARWLMSGQDPYGEAPPGK